MYHESWHYGGVSRPRTLDYCYGLQDCWNMAREKGTGWAYVNAESYALDAVASYVKLKFNLDMAPVPEEQLAAQKELAAASQGA